jgi:hypothetical protein
MPNLIRRHAALQILPPEILLYENEWGNLDVDQSGLISKYSCGVIRHAITPPRAD